METIFLKRYQTDSNWTILATYSKGSASCALKGYVESKDQTEKKYQFVLCFFPLEVKYQL